MSRSHLLSNRQAFVEQQIDVNVEVASLDAPAHSAHDLVEVGEIFDHPGK